MGLVKLEPIEEAAVRITLSNRLLTELTDGFRQLENAPSGLVREGGEKHAQPLSRKESRPSHLKFH